MQDSTKDGSAGGDRRSWRERLGVGQDLPKISDEFQPSHDDSEGDRPLEARGIEDAQSEPRSASHPASNAQPIQDGDPPGAKIGTPVRPAPMAPRVSRPTVQPGTDHSSGLEMPASKASDAKRPYPARPTLRPLNPPAQPAHKPAEEPQKLTGQAPRPGASQSQGPAPATARPGYSPRMSPTPTSQRPIPPTRGPAAYAPPGRSSTAAGNDSFGERLRAQREAAELLAQQRLAARDRTAHSGADIKRGLDPRHVEPTRQAGAASQPEPSAHPKPAGAEQPRFTFAQEEIAAAQRETPPLRDVLPTADGDGSRVSAAPPYTPPNAELRSEPHADGRALPGETYSRMPPPYEPPHGTAGEDYHPDARATFHDEDADRDSDLVGRTPDYRYEDDGMFEDEPPRYQATPARASAADYSAAYREFEDEFEQEEPRRGAGPMLVLLSLLAMAVIFGGVMYWYLQLQGSPAPEAAELPVIAAPEEAAKADPEPVQQPQAAVQPPRRKQIYDRILGQETLEPERIVPTEEEPRLRQIQQPQTQQPPRASDQSESPGAARPQQSTEPLPLPLPPPPGAGGTGEQGDLLVPGMANTVAASRSPEPARLALPEPAAAPARASDPTDRQTSRQASIQPQAGESVLPSHQAAQQAESRDAEAASQPSYPAPTASLPYPVPLSPLAYPEVAEERPTQDQTIEPEQATAVVLSDPEPEPEGAQASDVPLPRTKPEPPAGVRAATAPAPQTQPQPQPQPQRSVAPQTSGSGPMQITPTVLAPERATAAQQRQALQPQPAQQATSESPAPSRFIGREHDPLDGHRSSFSGTPTIASEPVARQLASPQQPTPPTARQQVAAVAPEAAPRQSEAVGGYVVQLASFRTESEALGEYQRLVQRYPALIGGLKSRVQQASLGQSGTFYRLGVGPVADRNAATKLCNDLIQAGEKDCLVRRN